MRHALKALENTLKTGRAIGLDAGGGLWMISHTRFLWATLATDNEKLFDLLIDHAKVCQQEKSSELLAYLVHQNNPRLLSRLINALPETVALASEPTSVAYRPNFYGHPLLIAATRSDGRCLDVLRRTLPAYNETLKIVLEKIFVTANDHPQTSLGASYMMDQECLKDAVDFLIQDIPMSEWSESIRDWVANGRAPRTTAALLNQSLQSALHGRTPEAPSKSSRM